MPPISFGEGNLRNLEAVSDALALGIQGIIFGGQAEKRDFAGGKAANFLEGFKKQGALFVCDTEEVLACMKNRTFDKII